jgi:hypothetical protein
VNPTRRKAAHRPLIALTVFACAALFAAAPAQAGGEFRDGFEDQLGRLAALEVFHVGHVLLTGHAAPSYAVHYVPYEVHYAPPQRHQHYKHHHKHPRHHVAHHRHHHGRRCDVHRGHGLHRGHHARAAVAERRDHRRHDRRDGRGWH